MGADGQKDEWGVLVKSYVKDGVLYCFYEIANFDEVISQALKEHNLTPGKINIICKPKKDMDMVDRMAVDHYGK